MQNKKRLQELDSLRGLAALAVLAHHFLYIYDIKYGYSALDFSDLEINQSIGRYGVELFFIISGFVISMTLDNRSGLKYFVISRFSRLFPSYWVCMCLTTATLYLLSDTFTISQNQFFYNLTMAPILFWVKPIDGSYWTLMYELIFYMLIGLIYLFRKTISVNYLALYTSLGVIAFVCYGISPESTRLAYILLLPHAQLFLAGVIFYKLWYNHHIIDTNNISNRYLWLLVSLIAIAQWIMALYDTSRLNYLSAGAISCFFILFIGILYNKLSWLTNKYLVHLGVISYPLYLIHQEIGYALITLMLKHGLNEYFVILFTTITMLTTAYLIHKLVEIPSNNQLKKILLKVTN